jgi:drug/metabolite transporter (DMT)-like permease
MTENSAGLLFGLLTVMSWTFCIFPFTQAARRLGSNALNHFRLFLATLLVAGVSLLTNPRELAALFTPGHLASWLWLGGSGIVGLMFGDYFAFRMYAVLGARMGSVLTTLAPAAALLLGGLLTSEHISVIGIIGIAITIAGIANVSFGKRERIRIPDHGHGSVASGVVFGILGAACQGAGLVLAKKALMAQAAAGLPIHPLNATFIRVLTSLLLLMGVTAITGNSRKVVSPLLKNKDGGIRYAVLGTLFGPFLGVALSLFTIERIDASVAQTIFSLVPASALVFAALFLKEKVTVQSVIGVIVALAGVTILIWRDAIAGVISGS